MSNWSYIQFLPKDKFVPFQTWLRIKMSALCILDLEFLLLVFCLFGLSSLTSSDKPGLTSNSHSDWAGPRERWKTGSGLINIAVMIMSSSLQPVTRQQAGAATKPMWQWQVDWTWKGGQEGLGGWVRGLLGPMLPRSLQPVTLARPGREPQAKGGYFKQKH